MRSKTEIEDVLRTALRQFSSPTIGREGSTHGGQRGFILYERDGIPFVVQAIADVLLERDDTIAGHAASSPFVRTLDDGAGGVGAFVPVRDDERYGRLVADALARQRGENLDGSPRRETVAVPSRDQRCAAHARPLRAGDHVLHLPSREVWTVAYVDGDRLAWCGWPEGEAALADCVPVRLSSDAEYVRTLRACARSEGRRARYAIQTLASLGIAREVGA